MCPTTCVGRFTARGGMPRQPFLRHDIPARPNHVRPNPSVPSRFRCVRVLLVRSALLSSVAPSSSIMPPLHLNSAARRSELPIERRGAGRDAGATEQRGWWWMGWWCARLPFPFSHSIRWIRDSSLALSLARSLPPPSLSHGYGAATAAGEQGGGILGIDGPEREKTCERESKRVIRNLSKLSISPPFSHSLFRKKTNYAAYSV
jgi:hypothetical protein